jgi:hypothetical protein
MSDEPAKESPAGTGDASGGDWREVTEALNALAASVGRATKAAMENEENRRRLQELGDGLASLARKVGESVDAAAATPEGRQVKEAVVRAAETVRDAGDKAAEQLRPHVLSAVEAANEKFRRAAEQWEKPAEPAPAPAAEPVVAPAGAPTAATANEPEPSPVVAPAAPEFTPVPTGRLEVIRMAHERFLAERKLAEAAAAASLDAAKAAKGPAASTPGEAPSAVDVANAPSDDDLKLW